MTTVVLIDDQAMIRAGLRGILEDAGISVVAEAADGRQGVEAVQRTRPDAVLLDLRMPIMDGVETVRRLRADEGTTGVRILVLTTFDADQDVIAALSAGADGFLGKTAEPEELVAAVGAVARGEASLSPRAARAVIAHLGSRTAQPADPALVSRVESLTARERDLVRYAAEGWDNQRIARELVISPHTVKTHLNRAMMKLDARDRGQLVAFAFRSGMLRDAPTGH
ncbi:response regulator [Microbacterium fluvii]|uniref:Response regulator n=1 Tax=Microbacterium fluvii TaxID=415215 RepID=A0ABW2HED6_9MICO|nr:response regulator transcription factor [Microbacterium fluvii]MCU4672440.1 response regulator transcription factor [Microbacterium fluvii]